MNYRVLITAVLLLAGLVAGAQEKRNLLQKSLEKTDIGKYLEKPYTPYAAYEDRAFWDAVPADVKEKAVKAAERAMEKAPASIPLTAYLEFVRIGDGRIATVCRGNKTASWKIWSWGNCWKERGVLWMLLSIMFGRCVNGAHGWERRIWRIKNAGPEFPILRILSST